VNIVADQNIALAAEAFAAFGDIVLLSGRDIDAASLARADILLTRSQTKVDAALLDDSPVKWVGCATSGVEHVDLEYLQARGIGFADAKGSNAVSVTEYVLSVLALVCIERRCDFADLSVGVIGYGEVGTRMVGRLGALGMPCRVTDPLLAGRTDRSLCSLDEALTADVVTVHVPLSADGNFPTLGLIGRRELDLLPDDVVLINAARGGVVDEQALLATLGDRPRIRAVIDCWEGEPAVNPALLERSFLATPHIAGHSYDGKVKGTRQIYAAACKHFDMRPRWVPSDQADDPVEMQPPRSLQQLVLNCYDVRDDSANFKECLSLNDVERAGRFDRLRGEYRQRREFSARRVTGEVPGASAPMLAAIGFMNNDSGET
jgi:erythronate-4-phosphate dehydrogenase